MCRSIGELARSLTCIKCRAVCYNEEVYEAPHVYDPERFLKDGELDVSSNDIEERIFGSGRRYAYTSAPSRLSRNRHVLTLSRGSVNRACPGKHFALGTLFLNFACTLAVFDITPPVGEKLDGKYHEGTFRCVMGLGSGYTRVTSGDRLIYV